MIVAEQIEGHATDVRGNTPDEAKLRGSLRYHVDHWLRGVPVTGVGAGGGGTSRGHVDRGMDGAAMEADLQRIVQGFGQPLRSACILSRVLPWKYELFVTVRDVELDDGTTERRETAELHWFVEGGWSGVLDPTIPLRTDPVRRRLLERHQSIVSLGYGWVDSYYRAVEYGSKLLRDKIDPKWIVA